jgi:hypothetical protein
MKLDRFWRKLGEAYPVLTKRSYKVLLVAIVTVQLRESRFSMPFSIETKGRNKEEAEDDMLVALSKTAT